MPMSTEAQADSKSYQRAKHAIMFASLGVAVTALIAFAFVGPGVDRLLRVVVGENRWLRAVATGFFYGAALELLSLPFDFWSGFILEHRYGLSNQRFGRWLWK